VTRALSIATFVAIGLIMLGLHRTGRRAASAPEGSAVRRLACVPSLREVLAYLMSSRTGRVCTLLSWWWVGWHFFAR
jgi:uncharacterized protein DUF6186